MYHPVQKSLFDILFDQTVIRTWIPRLMIPAVIMFSIMVGSIGKEGLLMRIALLIGGGIGLAILLWRPALGMFGVVLAGFFVPYSGPGGFNLSILGFAGLTGLWLLTSVLKERKIILDHPATGIPLLVLIVVSVISFLHGMAPWYPLVQNAPITAQAGGLAIFILSACAFLVIAGLFPDIKWLQFFTWLFVIVGALFMLGRVVPQVGALVNRYFQPGATSNSSIFWVWILIIPFSQMLLNNHLHKAWRAVLGLFVLCILYIAIFLASDWKSGYIPPLAGAATVTALFLRRKVTWFLPLAVFGAIYASNQALVTDEYSYITRVDAWDIVLDLSSISPVFGLGFSNYYWYTPLIPILGWSVNFNSHSQYVDIFAQTGIVGLLCFFWIFWEIGRLGWKLKERAPEGFARAYVYGVMGGVVGSLVAGLFVDWVLPFVYNIGMNGFSGSVLGWLFLGGLVIINRSIASQEQL